MSIEIIHIIRDLTDHGGRRLERGNIFCCEEMDASFAVNWTPNVDIIESEEDVEIRMELAGVSRDQLTIFLNNGRLVVQGARYEEKSHHSVYYHQLELSYGRFAKIICLPESIEHNDIHATLRDGLLHIKISKKSKVIEIPIMGESIQTKK